MTAAEFFRLPEPANGSRRELVRGVIVTRKVPGFRHGVVHAAIAALLHGHAYHQRCGRVTIGTGVITERDPDTVRGPDVAYWSAERLPLEQVPAGYPDAPADLCVEVLSPGDTQLQVQEKVREYLHRGVRLVWVVDPEARTVTVYRDPDDGRILWQNATLSGEDGLPGFSCRVAELFE
jgi:Uma2 family endonuclease